MTTVATYSAGVPAPSLLHNRGFLVFLVGRFVSRAGDALFSLASVWLVLDLTGNNALAGGAAAALEFLPYLIFGLLGGVLADRWDRRKTMASADLVRGLLMMVIPALATAGMLEVWHLFALIFGLSCMGRLFAPARQALVPEIVEKDQLVRANALVEGSSQAAWALGAAAGGVFVKWAGTANIFYLDAATFYFSAASLLLVRPLVRQPIAGRKGIWREAIHGVNYVRRTPVLAAGVAVSLVGVAAFAPVPVLLPVLVRRELGSGSEVFGLLMAIFFVGSVAGSALIGRVGKRLHRGRTIYLGVGVVGAAACLR
jgi:MFS family permease